MIGPCRVKADKSGCNEGATRLRKGLLWAPKLAIGAADFHTITSEPEAVTATGSNRARHSPETGFWEASGDV